jgi:hypothetical protein
MKSLALRTEPTVRQTEAIVSSIERELADRGAAVTRNGFGALRFQMPMPWRAHRPSFLLAITAGMAKVSAGSGEPWQIRYQLNFRALRILAMVGTVVLVAVGLRWSRLTLIDSIVADWVLLYYAPHYIAGKRFRRIVAASAREVVERRKAPRASPPAGAGEPPRS